MPDDLVERVARIIANAMGDNFADAFKNKTQWIAQRGESGGRSRDINEPMQCDYLAAAEAAIEASGLTQLTAERDALAAKCEALAGALGGIFAHFDRINTFSERGNAPGHGHYLPGIWDLDNEPGKAGKPCEWCTTWSTARAALAAYKGDAG